jgi:hypothetical protein
VEYGKSFSFTGNNNYYLNPSSYQYQNHYVLNLEDKKERIELVDNHVLYTTKPFWIRNMYSKIIIYDLDIPRKPILNTNGYNIFYFGNRLYYLLSTDKRKVFILFHTRSSCCDYIVYSLNITTGNQLFHRLFKKDNSQPIGDDGTLQLKLSDDETEMIVPTSFGGEYRYKIWFK